MAKAPTNKPAAAKAAASTTTTTAPAAPGMAVVNFDKAHHGGQVRGAVNGQPFTFPVDGDVSVTAEQLEVLTNSGARFSTVTPLEGAAEGSAAPSTTVEGTAIRLQTPAELGQGPKLDADGNAIPVPELRQITDKELTDGADQRTSKESAEKA